MQRQMHWACAPRWRVLTNLGVAGLATAVLAACQAVPSAPPAPPPPHFSTLPTDNGRHRIALLVPLSGANGPAGRSIANAATMAVLDTNAANLRITTYDTSGGAAAAAEHALADGNRLILGPLLGEDAARVADEARAAHVAVISYSNDTEVAGNDIFIMGNVPGEAIARVVREARSQGAMRFAALVPLGVYGERASKAMLAAVRGSGGVMVGMESYDRRGGTVAAAVRRLKAHGPCDAVLIADTGALAAQAATAIKAGGGLKPGGSVLILGTELWSGEASVVHSPALRGAEFAALSDQHFERFAASYRARFGAAPYRIATLGYDSVLLTLRIARDWGSGPFPTTKMYDRGGFLGLDGPFRFSSKGVIERALEVRQVRGGMFTVISPAPTRFAD
ncbi:MAG: penicillin-binding protein activator [Pseudomonadota bacterium]|nr:penicillin-binding protein activator [Pseudomonadota bacterium]